MFTILNTYNPMNWYWFVGGDNTQVYSSGAVAYVPVNDSTYVDWASSNSATNILNAEELYEVMQQQWIPPYLLAGVQIVSTGTPALNDTYSMDPASTQQITGIATSIAAGRGLPGGGPTFIFQGHVFSETSFLDFATAAENWVYAVYHSLAQIVLTGTGSLPTQPVTIA